MPRQERSRQKVELMLEAATRILEKDGLEGLTTNAIAAVAGVSIGTLYQYFPNKEVILDALAEHELKGMSVRVIAVMQDPSLEKTQDRVAALVRTVAATYDGAWCAPTGDGSLAIARRNRTGAVLHASALSPRR